MPRQFPPAWSCPRASLSLRAISALSVTHASFCQAHLTCPSVKHWLQFVKCVLHRSSAQEMAKRRRAIESASAPRGVALVVELRSDRASPKDSHANTQSSVPPRSASRPHPRHSHGRSRRDNVRRQARTIAQPAGGRSRVRAAAHSRATRQPDWHRLRQIMVHTRALPGWLAARHTEPAPLPAP